MQKKIIVVLSVICAFLVLALPIRYLAAEKKTEQDKKNFIRWVDFNITADALKAASNYDIKSYGSSKHLNWIELLSFLGTKYGGDFKRYQETDLNKLTDLLTKENTSMEILTKEMKYYSYYYEAYTAVLSGMLGEYEVGAENGDFEKHYGLKAFHPLAKNFPYHDYDDFGASRNYGFKRVHLGHDMMGQVGTPVIAIESGVVEAIGWNQYGGWRLGIRSFDQKRYYYYAHLRKGFPYNKLLKKGSIVTAGDVIGYLGRTGYSSKEDTNNIDTSHLHWGLQLIFDESQKEGNNEIWIDCYELTKFLYQNRSETTKNEETKEWTRIQTFRDPAVDTYTE